jgi:hypothetical protein
MYNLFLAGFTLNTTFFRGTFLAFFFLAFAVSRFCSALACARAEGAYLLFGRVAMSSCDFFAATKIKTNYK